MLTVHTCKFAVLQKRFTNLAIDELRIAAQEQQKITELRLAKLNIWRSKESGVATDLLSGRLL